MKNPLIKLASALVGSLLIAASSQATVISYSSGFSANNLTNYSSTNGYYASDSSTEHTNINLDRFDSSLGTLTGVDISFTSNWSHYSYASAYDSYYESQYHSYSYSCGTFGWSTCYSGYYTYSNDTWVSSGSNAQFSVALIDPAYTAVSTYDSNYDSCSVSYNYATHPSCSDSDYSANSYNGSLNLAGYSLNEFIGLDDLDLQFSNYASMYLYCDDSDYGDSCYAYNDAYWSGSVTVTYTYDETVANVSEPGTLLLLSLGLIGLGAARKRRS